MHIDSLYENKNEFLLFSKIVQTDSLTKEQIIKNIKNWSGTNFVNSKEVLVSETDEQLVYNYITNEFSTKTLGISVVYDWYIRLVIQIKDKKFRLLFYDDGNAYWPSTSRYTSNISARTYHLTQYFNKQGIAKTSYEKGLQNLKNSIIYTSDILEKNSKNKNINTDW